MNKHTPGPWKAVGTRVYFPNLQGGFDIRNCPNPEANARLIAAAPELLEALKRAVRQNEHDMVMTGEECRQCRAVIAKAEGQQ